MNLLLEIAQQNNGGCSHGCEASPGGDRICFCPDSMILSADDKTCVEPPTCNAEQFACKSGKVHCIPKSWTCDGVAECTDASDEHNCPVCSHPNYKCPGRPRTCLPPSKICDGFDDCEDMSDESCCRPIDFLCQADNRKHCVPRNYICDGKKDCPNAADEDFERCQPPLMTNPKYDVALLDNIDNHTSRDPSVTFSHPPNTYSAVMFICVVVFGAITTAVCFFRKRSNFVYESAIIEPDVTMTHTMTHPAALFYARPGISDGIHGKRVVTPSGVTASSFIPGATNPRYGQQPDPLLDVYVERSNGTGISSNSSSNGQAVTLDLHHRTNGVDFHPETMNPPPSPVTDHYDSSTRSSSQVGPNEAGGGSSTSSDKKKCSGKNFHVGRSKDRRNDRRDKKLNISHYPSTNNTFSNNEEAINDLDNDVYYGCPAVGQVYTNSVVDEDAQLVDDFGVNENDSFLQSNPLATSEYYYPETDTLLYSCKPSPANPPPSPEADD